MVAKVIAWGETREQARSRLADALSRTILRGTSTNLAYLRTILDCNGEFQIIPFGSLFHISDHLFSEFRAGEIATAFLDTFAYTYPCIEILDGGLATSVQDMRPRLTGDGDLLFCIPSVSQFTHPSESRDSSRRTNG